MILRFYYSKIVVKGQILCPKLHLISCKFKLNLSFRLISVLIQYSNFIFTPYYKPVKEYNFQRCRDVKGQQNLQKKHSLPIKLCLLLYMFNSFTLYKEMNK